MVERTVFIHLPGETGGRPGRASDPHRAGGLQVQASTFAYGRRYVARANAVPVDPISLALVPGRTTRERVPVGGLALFGALRGCDARRLGRRVIETG